MKQPRIRLWSDLHLEMRSNVEILNRLPRRADADLVLLAGDISAGSDGVRRAAALFADGPPIAYVLGNHEAYGGDLDAVIEDCREAAQGTTVRVLERDSWDALPGIRILGATLWTDFALWGQDRVEVAMIEAMRMADYRLIRLGGRQFTPPDALRVHMESRVWLERELGRASQDGVMTIVLTHHAPHPTCIAEEYRRDRAPLSASFASDLTPILEGPHAPAVWCSGHTHTNRTTRVGATKVMSNQAGYIWLNECPDFDANGVALTAI